MGRGKYLFPSFKNWCKRLLINNNNNNSVKELYGENIFIINTEYMLIM